MNDLADIQLSVLESLNSDILNRSFTKLIQNDTSIIPENNYVPNIWECKWYNSDAVPGYSKGYCVWRHSISSLNDFLKLYGDRIYNYTQDNSKLNTYLSGTWSQLLKDNTEEVYLSVQRAKYYNVISGYAEVEERHRVVVSRRQFYGPLFDFGDATPLDNDTGKRLEVYISLLDNNKAYLSDDSSWRSVVLSDQAAYDEYITTEIDLLFDQHIEDYHFSGILTSDEKVDENLIRTSLSNFDIDYVQQAKVESHNSYVNSSGLDFVKQFGKKEEDFSYDSKTYHLYRWFRLWNSGYLEHGGIIPVFASSKATYDPGDYVVSVDLEWSTILEGSSEPVFAQVYDYPETSSFYGEISEKLYYSTYHREDVLDLPNPDDLKVTQNQRYTVQVTPIAFDIGADFDLSGKLNDFKILSANGSGYGTALENQVSSFLTIEVHHVKNNSFQFTRNNTDDLSEKGKITFYSYHTTGYSLMSISFATIIGLQPFYEYQNGVGIIPTFSVKISKDKELVLGKDYTCNIQDNTDPGNGIIIIRSSGLYTGTLVQSFKITKLLSRCLITGLDEYYPYEGSPVEPSLVLKDPYYTGTVASPTVVDPSQYTVNLIGSTTTPGEKEAVVLGQASGDFRYSESISQKYTVYVDISRTTLTIPYSSYTYTGRVITPEVVVDLDGEEISQEYDNYEVYTISYSNNTNIGTASITVTGTKVGSNSITFSITKANASSLRIYGIPSTITFDTRAHNPAPTSVALNGIAINSSNYNISYSSDCTSIGTKTITFTGKNNLTGSISKTFEIVSKNINDSDVTVSSTESSYTYTGSEIIPTITIQFNGVNLVKNTDFRVNKVSGIDYVNVGANKRITISGIGNYTGTITRSYSITVNTSSVVITLPSGPYYYNRSEQKISPTSVTFNGSALTEGVNYSVSWPSTEYTLPGSKIVRITGIDDIFVGSKDATYTILGDCVTLRLNDSSTVKVYNEDGITQPLKVFNSSGELNAPFSSKISDKSKIVAFEDTDNIITSLGEYCFGNTTNLTSVSLPNVTTINGQAFYNATGLTSINLPKLTTMNKNGSVYNTFNGCSRLDNISIPLLTTALDESIFTKCNSLKTITASSSTLTSTSDKNLLVDLRNKKLISLAKANINQIENSDITSVIDNFYDNSIPPYSPKLLQISLPNVKTIGTNAFSNALDCRSESLEGISIPKIESLGDKSLAFANIYNIHLDNLTSSSGSPLYYSTVQKAYFVNMQNISGTFFRGCTQLEYVKFGSYLNSIGADVFKECTQNISVDLIDSATTTNNITINASTFSTIGSGSKLIFADYDTSKAYSTKTVWKDLTAYFYPSPALLVYSETLPTGAENSTLITEYSCQPWWT